MDTISAADVKSFYRALSATDRDRFASLAGTTTTYLEVHLVYGRRFPRPKRMDRLHQACVRFGAQFTKDELIGFFYRSASEQAGEEVAA